MNQCVLDSIVESINKKKAPDLSQCKDSRPSESIKEGDTIAGIWYDNPNWYAGKLEFVHGGLAIHINKDSVGYIEDADHVVKLCCKR